jgi:lipopolysaccharide transport protein LptA
MIINSSTETKLIKAKPVKVVLLSTLLLLCNINCFAQNSPSVAAPSKTESSELGSLSGGKLPTYIKSQSLTLDSNTRVFTYVGEVEVKRADLTINCDKLEGRYDQSNQITELIALKNVVITRAESMRAIGERATYQRQSETIILSENPEIQEAGSILSADTVTLYLKENRSSADGNVRVKLIAKDKNEQLS